MTDMEVVDHDGDVFHGLAEIAERMKELLSDDPDPKAAENAVRNMWPDYAEAIADAISDNHKLDWAVVFVAASIAELLCGLVGADVVYVRVPNPDVEDQFILLPIVKWRDIDEKVGEVPAKKNINHGPCDRNRTSGGNRIDEHNNAAELSGWYSEPEMDFLRWLKSEAWVPVRCAGTTRALIVFGKGRADFFGSGSDAIGKLCEYEKFVTAFYLLAEQTADRARKAELLERVAAVLPALFDAQSHDAFARGLLTLYTTHTGFAFNRALLFLFPNGQYPAECRHAVGGMGTTENRPDRNYRANIGDLKRRYPELAKHVAEALADEYFHADDSLAAEIRKRPIFFQESDQGWLKSFFDGTNRSEGVAKRLDETDPWIATVRRNRPGVFVKATSYDECFVLPLAPLGLKSDEKPLGFLLVDLTHHDVKHAPGIDFPDLRMAALVLHLVASMWQARQDGESYLHVIEVLHVLQHEGPMLGVKSGLLKLYLERDFGIVSAASELDTPFPSNAPEALHAIIDITKKLDAAADLIDNMQGKRLRNPVVDLRATVEECLRRKSERYPGCTGIATSVESGVGVKMPVETLHAILDCLAKNAVDAVGADNPVMLTVRSERITVPEGPDGKVGQRISLMVSNNGPSIDARHAPYLFVSRVSTTSGLGHMGSGLSNARRLVKACGGDLILRSRNPVEFEIVLEPDDQESDVVSADQKPR